MKEACSRAKNRKRKKEKTKGRNARAVGDLRQKTSEGKKKGNLKGVYLGEQARHFEYRLRGGRNGPKTE